MRAIGIGLGLPFGSRAGGGVAGAATFASIFGADLVGWYDASDAATITQAAGAVSQWNDKSGRGIHLVQATGSKQPVYSATGLGSAQPAITFATDDHLATAADVFTFPASTSAWAVFAVARMLTGTPANAPIITFGTFAPGMLMRPDPASNNLTMYRGSYGSVKAVSLDTTFRAASVVTGGNSTIYVNNSAGTTVAMAGGDIATTNTLVIGNLLSSATPWAGPICEIAIIKRAPTAPERTSVETMLAAKWTV